MNEAAQTSAQGELTLAQQMAYGVPQVAIAVGGMLIGTWLTYFYLPPDTSGKPHLVSAVVFAALMFVGRLVDAVADPLIGYWSDRTRSRLGRRIPFILWGTPLLAASFAGLFFPPFAPGSLGNNVYLGAMLFAYWVLFTVVVAPYTALLPEIATSNRERMRLSSVMAIFMMIGNIFAALIGALESNNPDGLVVLGLSFGSGIQAAAAATAVATVVLFLGPVFRIRETPHDARKDVPPGILDGVLSAFKNPAFRTYLGVSCFFQMGLTVLATGLPYIASQVLEAPEGEERLVMPGQGETWVGILMGILVLLALVQIPLINALVTRWGKKRLLIRGGVIFTLGMLSLILLPVFSDPAYLMLAAIVVMSFPAAAAFVLPMPVYADVVDLDEQMTGVRREGVYTGAGAVLAKAAIGLSMLIGVGLLELGNSRSEPLGLLLIGPTAAALIALGTWIFSHHPIED